MGSFMDFHYELMVAERFAIAISGADEASANLDLGIDTPPVSLANASLSASFTVSSNVAWSGLSLEGGPLMFEASRVHDSPLGERRHRRSEVCRRWASTSTNDSSCYELV